MTNPPYRHPDTGRFISKEMNEIIQSEMFKKVSHESNGFIHAEGFKEKHGFEISAEKKLDWFFVLLGIGLLWLILAVFHKIGAL